MSPRRLASGTALVTAAAALGYVAWSRKAERDARQRRRADRARERQPIGEGTGPLFFRRYQTDIAEPDATPHELIARIKADVQACTPPEVARFEKTRGAPGRMAVGDRYHIHITGPWDGPVEVADTTPTSFTLATLDDHMEAGRITFEALYADAPAPPRLSSDLARSAAQPGATGRPEAEQSGGIDYSEGVERPKGMDHPKGMEYPRGVRFRIYSRARSHTAAVDVTYRWMGAARAGQTHMWTRFCEEAARMAGAKGTLDVDVRTFEAPYADPLGPRDARRDARRASVLAELAERALNFDPDVAEAPTEGFNRDDDRVHLAPEPPGPPLEDGSFARAVRWVRAYRFPDPRRVRGVFDPETDLEGRTMLLDARFLGFRFPFGVRVSRVLDHVRPTPEGDEHVWGYSYRTLEGHFERGEITFEIVKRAWSGGVHFRVHSFSQRARIANPLYRIGFRLLGRTLQRQFARYALESTRRYVLESLTRDACLRDDPAATAMLLDDRTHPDER